MLSTIVADFSGYGRALGMLYLGYILLLIVATLALLQFLKSFHFLIKQSVQSEKPRIVPTVFWGMIATAVFLLPSFLFELGASKHFTLPQNLFRISLGIVAIVWSRHLRRNGVTRLEGLLALSWGLLVLVNEVVTAIYLVFMSRTIKPGIREVFDFVFSLQSYFDTLTMILFVLLSYVALQKREKNLESND